MKKHLMASAITIIIASMTSCQESKPKDPQAMWTEMMEQRRVPLKRIGILLYDGFATLDALGPYHVLGEISGSEIFFIGRDHKEIRDARGATYVVSKLIHEVDSLDVLVVPGGAAATYAMTKDSVVLNWIRKIDRTTRYTASVCTGAWILGAADLLRGKRACTHWAGKKILEDEFGASPAGTRWSVDGKYWTSAGVSAGIDMSLALVEETQGRPYAESVMLDLEYDPQPPFKGGSPEKSDPDMVFMMRSMYDMVFENMKNGASPSANHAVNEIDPVCGMSVKEGVGAEYAYQGVTIGFCSRMCKDLFVANPEKYAQALKN